jgi:hypothetical protein
MFISHQHKFIFIKTRKTAGSSIEKFFLDTLDSNIIFGGMPPENLDPINCNKCIEHKGWKFVGKRYKKEWQQYYKFTIERNPWDKVVSLYHWQLKTEPQHQITTFDDYILNRKKLYNKKDWQLYTKDSIPVVDFIIRYENINEDFATVCKSLNIPYNNELNKINLKSSIRKNKSYRDFYNTRTKNIISNVFKKEIEYFNYEF